MNDAGVGDAEDFLFDASRRDDLDGGGQDGLDTAIEEAEGDGAGLRRALLVDDDDEDGDGDEGDEGGDIKVEELERMMGRMRAVRGTYPLCNHAWELRGMELVVLDLCCWAMEWKREAGANRYFRRYGRGHVGSAKEEIRGGGGEGGHEEVVGMGRTEEE